MDDTRKETVQSLKRGLWPCGARRGFLEPERQIRAGEESEEGWSTRLYRRVMGDLIGDAKKRRAFLVGVILLPLLVFLLPGDEARAREDAAL